MGLLGGVASVASNPQVEMLNIGPQELLIILVIALVVVGPQRLPALGRSIGRGLREFRRAQDEVKRTIQVTLDEDEGLDGERAGARPPTTAGPTGEAERRETRAPREGPARPPRESPPTRVRRDPTPSASEPLPAKEVREVTRTLGRSLAELRKAREEVQRSFRVDLSEPERPAPGRPERPEPPSDGTD